MAARLHSYEHRANAMRLSLMRAMDSAVVSKRTLLHLWQLACMGKRAPKNRIVRHTDKGARGAVPASTGETKESNDMKRHFSIALALLLATSAGASTQDVASDADKGAKDAGQATAEGTKGTAHGTTKAVDKTSSCSAQGVKRGFEAVGHGIREAFTKPINAAKCDVLYGPQQAYTVSDKDLRPCGQK